MEIEIEKQRDWQTQRGLDSQRDCDWNTDWKRVRERERDQLAIDTSVMNVIIILAFLWIECTDSITNHIQSHPETWLGLCSDNTAQYISTSNNKIAFPLCIKSF